MTEQKDLNHETRSAWDANASIWDERMGENGNDFFRILQWPAIVSLLDLNPSERILDVACGNGLTSRKLAEMGASVTAFDFSEELIEKAQGRPNPGNRITYHVLDATDEKALLEALSPAAPFDSSLCNMALFDIADIEPLFRVLSQVLKSGGIFVFSITHPAFNNSSSVHVAEEMDDGRIKTVYSVKVSRYMNPYHARGVALRDQPEPQLYFERPLQFYLNLGFENGFVLDGFAERAFPPDYKTSHPLSWGGQFSEIPPVLVARMRLL